MDWHQQAISVGSALASGALVGLERGWTYRREAAGARVAGVRTFALLGLAGGVGGLIAVMGAGLSAAILMAAMAALLAAGYARSMRDRADATTAVTAILVLAIGFLAGMGGTAVALASAAATVLLLALREELHGFVERLEAGDIKAMARYAVIALAVLPFLPDRPMGPYGAWNPAQLWWVVVLVTGFSFAGYVANRVFGARHGTIATAMIGGAYSSTAVTQALSRRLGTREAAGAEPAGIALASAVMYLRVMVLVSAFAGRFLLPLLPLLFPPLVVVAVAGWWLYRRAPVQEGPEPPGNPIALVPALGFVIFVAVAAVAARWAEIRFGGQGLALLIFLMGVFDVDASIVTAGALPPGMIGPSLGGLAIGGTVAANMLVKFAIVLAYARRKGVGVALVLLAGILLSAALLFVAWRMPGWGGAPWLS